MAAVSPLSTPELARTAFDGPSFVLDEAKLSPDAFSKATTSPARDSLAPSSKRATFTPTRVQPVPRAWERKPSTPFAPRTDAQKIWKRVPLQAVKQSSDESERTAMAPSDKSGRPVKRLRVGSPDSTEDKENIEYVPVKWGNDVSPQRSPRRRVPMTTLSPPRALLFASSPEAARPPPALSPPESSFEDSSDVQDDSDLTEEDELAVEEVPMTETEREDSRGQHNQRSDESCTPTAQLLEEADVFLRIPPNPSPVPSTTSESSLTFSPIRIDLSNPTPIMASNESVEKHRSSIEDPPMIQVTAQDSENSLALAPNAILTHAHTDPDDTSYLQDFLLRSRAQKAARLQDAPPVVDNLSVIAAISVPESPARPQTSFTFSSFQIGQNSAPIASNEDEAVSEEIQVIITSPQRRSSRLTRLPRPQKPSTTLPSNIALRRLTGTEFISMQKKVQSLAVATRTNTMKNKGAAIAVHARLQQLKSDSQCPSDNVVISGKRKTVTWDDTLVRFQDYTGPLLPPSPDSEKEDSSAGAAEEPEEEEPAWADKSHPKNVKKRRKDSVGSVNGTPAPKRSIQILLEDAARATGQIVNTQDDVKRTRSRARFGRH